MAAETQPNGEWLVISDPPEVEGEYVLVANRRGAGRHLIAIKFDRLGNRT